MPSINIDPDFFSHIKTKRLNAIVGPRSEIYLIRLWCIVARHSPKAGELVDWTAEELESCVDYDGEKGQLVQAMLKTGWIHKTTTGWKMHDWHEHEGHLGAYKDRAKKMAEARWSKRAVKNAVSNATSIPSSNATSNSQAMPMQCNAVHTTTTTTCDDSKNTLEPETKIAPGVVLPEVPEDLASLARENLGDDGAAFVRNYLALYDADWIRAAILELAHEPKASTRRRRLMYKLLDYKANGGPPTGEERSTRSTSRGQGVSRKKGGKYAELDKRAYTG